MEDNFERKISYVSKKYLFEFTDTLSLAKINESLENKTANPRLKKIATVYAILNNKKVDKFKHNNFYNEYFKIQSLIDGFGKLSKKEIIEMIISKNDFNLSNKIDLEYKKVFRNIYSKCSYSETKNKIKENERVKIEKFMNAEKLSFNSLSKYVSNKEIDVANLYRFVRKKEYNKISVNKLIYLRNKIEEFK